MRVVDFTHVLAGPACAYMLGCLGAEVIKVEGPRGDAMRHRGGTDPVRAAHGASTAYLAQAAGKRSVVLDLETPRGAEAMRRLLARADVLVENHLPETARSLGISPEETAQLNPRLIHCAMTGYGRGSEMADTPAYDVNIQAATGLMEMTGTAESGPLRAGAPVMDYGTALAAGFAICAALVERERTGRGGLVDVSMFETGLTLMASTVTDLTATGNVPTRRGNAANSRSPAAGSFPCADGILSVGVNEAHQFAALAHAIGRGDWLDDPRYRDADARRKNGAALAAELGEALATRPAEEWEAILRRAGVPVARQRRLDEAIALPHLVARGFLAGLGDGDAQATTLPFRIGTHRPGPAFPPSAFGADTDDIMAELGLPPD
nr:CoA transferase [Jannaschia sp. S6380]